MLRLHCLPAFHDFETKLAKSQMALGHDIREVEDEVYQIPVYAAERWLKTGMLPDGTQTVGAKLDLAALKEMYGEGPAAPLPPYLQAEHYDAIVDRVGRITLAHANLTEHLAGLPDASRDRYILLDAQDWMTDLQLNALWQQITRTAQPDARVIFRTAAEPSLLPGRLAPDLLAQWIGAASLLLHSAGVLTLIWRADGLADVLKALEPDFGSVAVLPVHGREGQPAIRVIVRASKGARAPLALVPALVLNDAAGKPTAEAEEILRDAQPIKFG